jgi:hypothetical protein
MPLPSVYAEYTNLSFFILLATPLQDLPELE